MSERAQDEFVKAAGGLIWRKRQRGWQILAVHRARYDDWSLPKGKLESGETWQEAAEREVTEETGLTVTFLDFAGATTYYHGRRPKVVLFWNTTVSGETDSGQDSSGEQSPEVDEMKWLDADQAAERLSYPAERALVAENWPD
ncbi:MAG: NUDIX hydrolase [Chloroflexota bacterium]|nr:MAG: NUDIX hydrolase [Chloroflexota bacterium]